MAHIYIAAAHKSSGKTSVSIGLTAALTARGQAVQTFKKGPDYIDPLWLARSSGRSCYNLDFNTMDSDELRALFASRMTDADVGLIEGNKGLYDGVDLEGADSNAAMAKLLGAPVVLVIDTVGITRGVAPLVLGYQAFDADVNIAGVILNKVGGARHEAKLVAAMAHYTDVPVLGAIGRDAALEIPERHLGLIPANESDEADAVVARLSAAVAEGVDLDVISDIAGAADMPDTPPSPPVSIPKPDVRIAIARDAAFGFYYADDLEAFAAAGAELVPFDALSDPELPEADGLFIGGGFPETHMAALAANESLLADIGRAIEGGLPAYAECGGLIYLAEDMSWGDDWYGLVGAIPGSIDVHDRPQGRGYVELQETSSHPWSGNSSAILPAHEFHYGQLSDLPKETPTAYDVKRGHGIDGERDGLIVHNLLASFSHQRNTAANPWVSRFVEFVRQCAANS